ncbi:MAG TPA: DNA-directed RNA polymerase subunit omega [Nitrospinota bacterium]|nr:DNA-directed RNA polymerase subunit omega [Nitrospinota bacterium]
MMRKDRLSDAIKKIPNRFLFINVVVKRIHQLKKDNNIIKNDDISLEDRALEELIDGKLEISFKDKTKNQEEKK